MLDTRRVPRRAGLAATMAIAFTVLGCRGSPIDRRGERSQYDRHEAIRGNRADPYVEDEFGRMVPNLRARLLPRE